MAPRTKVEIEYPAVTTRKWKPPAMHLPHDPLKKQVFLNKPIYPKKYNKFKWSSTLKQVWHRYVQLTSGIFILRGNYNQQCIKYVRANRGKQQAASCLACIGIMQCCPPEQWTEYTIDRILDLGDRIYTDSVNRKRATTCCCISEVSSNFFSNGDVCVNGFLLIHYDFKIENEKLYNRLPRLFVTVQKICLDKK